MHVFFVRPRSTQTVSQHVPMLASFSLCELFSQLTCPHCLRVFALVCGPRGRRKAAPWRLSTGQRFHAYKRNKLVRSKVRTHKQRLHYEAIIQVAEIRDQDLLYLSFNNAAMGATAYCAGSCAPCLYLFALC